MRLAWKEPRKSNTKKIPKHVKHVYFDEDLRPDTHHAVVNLKMKDGTSVCLKGKSTTLEHKSA